MKVEFLKPRSQKFKSLYRTPCHMKKYMITAAILAVFLSSAFASNGLIEKYRHHFLDLKEADVDSIITLLNDPDSLVRSVSAVLVQMAFYKKFPSALKAVPGLVSMLNNDSCISVRRAAASALSKSGSSLARESLSKQMLDKELDPMLKVSILRGLSRMGSKDRETMKFASENLYSSNHRLGLVSVWALIGSEDRKDMERVVHFWIDLFEQPDSTLLNTPPFDLTVGKKNLLDEYLLLLYPSLESIARQAPDLLEPALSHSHPTLRYESARTLARERDNRAVPVLIDILINDKDWHNRRGSARCLGLYGPDNIGEKKEAAISALREALKDEHVEESPFGAYRPVAASAYSALIALGVQVEMPEDMW